MEGSTPGEAATYLFMFKFSTKHWFFFLLSFTLSWLLWYCTIRWRTGLREGEISQDKEKIIDNTQHRRKWLCVNKMCSMLFTHILCKLYCLKMEHPYRLCFNLFGLATLYFFFLWLFLILYIGEWRNKIAGIMRELLLRHVPFERN